MAAPLAVVHDIPGRLRLRLPRGTNTAELAAVVGRQSGVLDCHWAARTRSLLIQYQPGVTSPSALVQIVAAHSGAIAAPRTEPAADDPVPRPSLARALAGGFGELDRGVVRATRGALDLRILLPLALAGWALREILRGQVGPLAWSSALWYAHGLFRDYNLPGGES
jgi:Heavy metal associated domain 2